jgi:acyl-CoA thioesterase
MARTGARQHLAEAVGRAMLTQDKATPALGIVLEEIGPGHATMRMSVRDDMINGHDVCHGGLIFTLADGALAFAANAHNRVSVVAAAEIQFISPARQGETLLAVARERASAGRSGIYDVEVTEVASGRLVALLRGRSHRLAGNIVDEATP